MEPRLKSSILVGALIRRAEAEGGFAAVIAKGDSSAGSVLVVLRERGGNPRIFERVLQPNGSYAWQDTGPVAAVNDVEAEKFLARRRNFDPDLWILELDIPSADRFAAQMAESV